jgi:hypothetical protein
MKEIDINTRSKYYEYSDDITYKRKNIDFNEYGFNKYNTKEDNLLNYNAKTGPNCVKKVIKR